MFGYDYNAQIDTLAKESETRLAVYVGPPILSSGHEGDLLSDIYWLAL